MSDENERAMILENFQQITNNHDIGVCLAILEEHNWNLDNALKSTVSNQNQPRAGPSPLSNSQRETTSGTTTSNNVNSFTQRTPSSILIPQSRTRNTGTIGSIFTFVMELILRIAHSIPVLGHFIRAATQRDARDPNPRAAAARFLLNYEQKYGQTHPDFFQGSYNQALQRASQNVTFLLVYMHCEDHQDTDNFCRQVLPSQEFRSFIHEKEMVFWAGNIKEIEPYQVSLALQVSTYPFLGLVGFQGTRMTILSRIEGFTTLPELMSKLNQIVSRYGGALRAARMERDSREFERELREQQNREYEEALREDQERERRKKEEIEKEEREKERKKKEEEDARIAEENKKKEKELKKASLPDEPPQGIKGTTTIRVRLPNGTQVQRRFLENETVQTLYNYVESIDNLPYSSISITTSMPKKVYDDEKKSTLKEAGLCPNATVFIDGNA